jgi:hypothetical protein
VACPSYLGLAFASHRLLMVTGKLSMKKSKGENVELVHSGHEPKKPEKLGLVAYFTVRRHSRVLYLPLDATAVRLHDVQKGDIIKAKILELRKAPRPDDALLEPKNEWKEERYE